MHCRAQHDPLFRRDAIGRSAIFRIVYGLRSSCFLHAGTLVIPQCTCSSFGWPLCSPACHPSQDRLMQTRTSMACHKLCPIQHTTRLNELKCIYRGGVHLLQLWCGVGGGEQGAVVANPPYRPVVSANQVHCYTFVPWQTSSNRPLHIQMPCRATKMKGVAITNSVGDRTLGACK